MQFDLTTLLQIARGSILTPRRTAQDLLSLRLSSSTGLIALTLMVVLTAALSTLAFLMFPADMPAEWAALFANPLKLALTQGVILMISVMLILGVGKMFGGTGSFADALILMAWIEFFLLVLQVLQVAMLLLAPPLAEVLGLLGGLAFLWLLSHFVAELHGFRSAGMVFAGIVACVLLISFGMALLLVMVTGARG